MKKRLILGTLLVVLLAAAPARAAAPNLGQIDSYIEHQMAEHRLPGLALVITRGGQVLYMQGYGRASRDEPMTSQTPMFLASLSKSFTALAVLQLVEAGAVELDAPVQRYLPEFTTRDPASAARITVRQLLNHTSGLADSGFPELSLPQVETPTRRLALLRAASPIAPPGQEFHYFNPNYEILAALVEAVSGQPFSAYLQEHIFSPAGMAATFHANRTDEAYRQASGLAQGHLLPYAIAIPANEMAGFIGGSGGVVSTAEDLARFLILLNQGGRATAGEIVSPQSIAQMTTPPASPDTSYGMGWFVHRAGGQRILEHNGVFSAFYAEAVLLPEQQVGIGLLYNANSLAASATAFPQIKDGLIALVNDRTPQAWGVTVTHLGVILGLLTVLGITQALVSLLTLSRWARRARRLPFWRLLAGILWALLPAGLIATLPYLSAWGSGRVFGYPALMRSMPELFIWLGVTAVLGIAVAFARIGWSLGRALKRARARRSAPAV